jgi:exodeoxyribonuclease V beta subunit
LVADKRNGLINFIEPIQNNAVYPYRHAWKPSPVLPPIPFDLAQQNWTRLSYTMLAAKSEISAKPRSGKNAGTYDLFIYNQLTRGAKTGNLLHYLFENIDFSSAGFWQYHVAQAIKRFAPGYEKEYTPMLLQLLGHVTNAIISINGDSFIMANISPDKRLNELEFDFNVPLFSPSALHQFENTDTIINLKYLEQAEGVMNGKVDLFFEHNNKYYILDWKSNYLGDDVSYYGPQLLHSAMSESNYHLQYLIYTVAVKKYLESRLPSFDYESQFGGVIYMYVRGVRSNSDTGIFITRPSLQQIKALGVMLSE